MSHKAHAHRNNSGLRGAVFIGALCVLTVAHCTYAEDIATSDLREAAWNGDVTKEVELAQDYLAGRGLPKDLK